MRPPEGSHLRMREKPILRVVTRLLAPFILLFALYVQFHGDYGPGGGFQAGVLFAAAFILYGLVHDAADVRSLLPEPLVEALIAVGVLVYGGVGVASMLLGGTYLDYDVLPFAHPQHIGIVLVEAGVGIAVAATILRLYYAFSFPVRPE